MTHRIFFQDNMARRTYARNSQCLDGHNACQAGCGFSMDPNEPIATEFGGVSTLLYRDPPGMVPDQF